MQRRRLLPVSVLLAGPCTAWALYLVLALDARPDDPEVLAVVRLVASTLAILAMLTYALQQLLTRLDQGLSALRAEFRHELGLHDNHMVSATSGVIRTLTAIEHAIDCAPARRVGLASVTAEQRIVTALSVIEERTDELPGYAMGYADGLARKPMADGNVVPINGTKH